MVELASAVVGHIDPLDAVIERDGSVFRGRDPLDDQRYLVLVLDQLDGAPFQPLLEVAAGGADTAGAHITLGDIALAPAVMRGVDRQAKRAIAICDRAADAVFDIAVAAADIELIDAQTPGRGLGGPLQAGPRCRAH